MTAYWLAQAKVIDPEAYGQYATRVPEIVANHGGTILARGGPFEVLEGSTDFERFVVIAFDSMEAARACHASAEYVAAASHRRSGAGLNQCVIVEGV